MNYNELIANAPRHAFATDEEMLTLMPQFIRQAERRLARDLERDAFRYEASGTLDVFDGRINLRSQDPTEVQRLKITVDGVDVVLTLRSLEFLEALFNDGSVRGVPQFYAETSDRNLFKLFPWPESAWPWTARITVSPEFLTPSNPTNVLTERFGNLLEADVFRRIAKFKRHPEAAADHKAEYMEELALANAEIRRSRRDDTEIRAREITNRVGA